MNIKSLFDWMAEGWREELKPKEKNWLLSIKSHCEMPDYERETMAVSKKEAAKKFWDKLPDNEFGKGDWSPENLMEHIGEEEIGGHAENIHQGRDWREEVC